MSAKPRPVELSSGERVRIRPIDPGDRDALREAFERLSMRSRYQRFFSPVSELSEGTLDYLTRVDHHDHEALVALDDESGDLVGVARYVRLEDGIAEPAITVVDDWQGRGLSGPLLARLVDRAIEEGYRDFRAYVLADNPRAVAAMRRLGETTASSQGATIELDIALDEREAARARLADVVRNAASGVVSQPLTVWRRLGTIVRVAYAGHTEPWTGGDELGDAIVVGTCGTETSRVALRSAIALGRVLDRPVHVVVAYRPLMDSRSRADELLRAVEAGLRDVTGVETQVHLRLGDAAEALIDVAEQARAHTIVVGAGGSRRGLVGDVADKVARHAPCNVLVARPGRAG